MFLEWRFFPLDMIKPPCYIFGRSSFATGAALIQQPMSLAATFQDGPYFFFVAVAFIGCRQNSHADAGAILCYPSVFSRVLAIATKMLSESLVRFARTPNITDFLITFQVQAIDVKHKILRALSSRRIGFTISAVTAADTGCHHPPGVLAHSLGTCFSTE